MSLHKFEYLNSSILTSFTKDLLLILEIEFPEWNYRQIRNGRNEVYTMDSRAWAPHNGTELGPDWFWRSWALRMRSQRSIRWQ